METISTSYIQKIITPRPRTMHKGHAGRILIAAGSKGMMGAAVLAARGALYSGGGLVRMAIPENQFSILQTAVPEAMCVERSEVAGTAGEYDAVCIGPGIGVSEETAEFTEALMEECRKPVLLDADGINCLCRYKGLDKIRERAERNIPTVVTPHPGEADRMLSALGAGSYRQLGREECAGIIAAELNAVVVLKGADTIVADGFSAEDRLNPYMMTNPTGNPGMATGGSGDVLSGIITSLLAQKNIGTDPGKNSGASPMEAAAAGVFIHGLSGDIAAENVGEYGMTAADIADAVSAAFRAVCE